jgi:hypothetical protein
METLPSANAGMVVEQGWRLAGASFFCPALGSKKFLLEALDPLNGPKSDERRKVWMTRTECWFAEALVP